MSQETTRHRICFGTFDNMPAAQRALKEAAEKGAPQAFVQMIHPKNNN